MEENKPVITIIVAVYNSDEKLDRCLKSISQQTYKHVELIVMDGGSVDHSTDIIRKYQKDITYWESNKDKGIYHAWNKSLTHSSGDWVCFLGADDYFWDDSVLARLVPHLNDANHKHILIVYGQVAIIDVQNRVKAVRGKPWDSIGWQMRHGMPIELPHTGMMHHRSLFEKQGLFDESFRIAGDYEFLLRHFKRSSIRALYLERTRVAAREEGGVSEVNKLGAIKEVARAKMKNGIYPYSLFWVLVWSRAIVLNYIDKKLKILTNNKNKLFSTFIILAIHSKLQ